VGFIALELRYMDKDELIGFVYSPQNNPNFTKRHSHANIIAKATAKLSPTLHKPNMKKNQSFLQESHMNQPSNR
jgi:hypothetical protein